MHPNTQAPETETRPDATRILALVPDLTVLLSLSFSFVIQLCSCFHTFLQFAVPPLIFFLVFSFFSFVYFVFLFVSLVCYVICVEQTRECSGGVEHVGKMKEK